MQYKKVNQSFLAKWDKYSACNANVMPNTQSITYHKSIIYLQCTMVGGQLIVANTEKTYEVYDVTEMYKRRNSQDKCDESQPGTTEEGLKRQLKSTLRFCFVSSPGQDKEISKNKEEAETCDTEE